MPDVSPFTVIALQAQAEVDELVTNLAHEIFPVDFGLQRRTAAQKAADREHLAQELIQRRLGYALLQSELQDVYDRVFGQTPYLQQVKLQLPAIQQQLLAAYGPEDGQKILDRAQQIASTAALSALRERLDQQTAPLEA